MLVDIPKKDIPKPVSIALVGSEFIGFSVLLRKIIVEKNLV